MSADDGANIPQDKLINTKPLFHQFFNKEGVFFTVAMGNKDYIILIIAQLLLHIVNQSDQRLLTASNFSFGDQLSRVVYMQNRLNSQHRSHNCGGLGDSSAPMEIFQIFHRKIVAQVKLVFL